MSDVKWIKIVTDLFDDEKILLIETLPDADQIIVIWFKILCLAGKINNKGVLILNDRIVYTEEMLATIFRRKISTVRLALKTFEEFGMIEIINDTITIPNWRKHQSLDQLEQKKEYMREYMQEYREKQKQIACKTNSKTNSKTNVRQAELDIDLELEVDLEVDLDIAIAKKPKKIQFADDVTMEQTEYDKLLEKFGETKTEELINRLSLYKGSKGATYKSDYKTILVWESKDSKTTGKGNMFFEMLREDGEME